MLVLFLIEDFRQLFMIEKLLEGCRNFAILYHFLSNVLPHKFFNLRAEQCTLNFLILGNESVLNVHLIVLVVDCFGQNPNLFPRCVNWLHFLYLLPPFIFVYFVTDYDVEPTNHLFHLAVLLAVKG